MPTTDTVRKRLERKEQQDRAIRLRILGAQGKDIAKELGVSEPTVSRWIKAACQVDDKEAAVLRGIHLRRLEDLIKVYGPKARRADNAATDRYLKILEQEMKLCGYNVPVRQQIEVTGNDVFVDRAAELMAIIEGTQDAE